MTSSSSAKIEISPQHHIPEASARPNKWPLLRFLDHFVNFTKTARPLFRTFLIVSIPSLCQVLMHHAVFILM